LCIIRNTLAEYARNEQPTAWFVNLSKRRRRFSSYSKP
jgi:hypothetical protein